MPTFRQIRTRYFPFRVTTPAGTTAGNPVRTVLDVPDTILRNVELRIPNGHVGVTGFALDYGGTRIVPWGTEADFIIGDNDLLQYPFDFNVSSGLVAVTYNLGVYDHSHYLRIRLDDLPAMQPGLRAVQPLYDLSAAQLSA